jgi:hypothetical protein
MSTSHESGASSGKQLAGRLVVGLAGPWPTAEEVAWLEEWRPAGVILFARNVTGFNQLAALCAMVHRLVPGCEVMADHEGGPVSQLAAAVGRPPAAWTLGALGDTDLTREVHRETARRLANAGVDRVLAPCADVLLESRNPVIGARSFGEEGSGVAAQVTAAVMGLRDGGIKGCLKHWPGHGSSGRDTHLSSATVAGENGEAPPFLAGLRAGAGAVMVGHLTLPGASLPATLDTDRLGRWRQELEAAAAGPVLFFADDVTMGGLRPAMAQLGVVLADGLEEGMIDPGILPRSWLQNLASAGLDRILIRGIPWLAFPLTAEAELDFPADSRAPLAGPEPSWPTGPYEEARGRARSGIEPGFLDVDLTLGWLDLTAGDRWEVATDEFSDRRLGFARHLMGAFARVVELDAAELTAGQLLQRLLITSHRPLPEHLLKPEYWAGILAPQGVCLTLGHPGLAGDMKAILGPGWSLTPYHEIDWSLGLT